MLGDFENLAKSYAGRKVLITGNTGFKGAWLSFLLKELGAEIYGYSLPPTSDQNLFSLLGLNTIIPTVYEDIRDFSKLNSAFQELSPDFVFHLAAQALVRPSYQDPRTTFEVNVLGGINLLEAVKACRSVRSLVFVTSDKCYENLEWIWGYRESDKLGGHDPYSASKAAAEIAFSSYYRSFFENNSGIGCASARAGNVIGGGDWSVDRLVPDCIRAISRRQSIKLRNPESNRPWQHVFEPLRGYLMLGAALIDDPKTYGGAWNFGPLVTDATTVKNIAEGLVSSIGMGSVVLEPKPEFTGMKEASLLQLNCDKANQLLGWKPKWTVSDTIKATGSWYGAYLEKKDMIQISREQLKQYFEFDSD